jgi:hypothetical protein
VPSNPSIIPIYLETFVHHYSKQASDAKKRGKHLGVVLRTSSCSCIGSYIEFFSSVVEPTMSETVTKGIFNTNGGRGVECTSSSNSSKELEDHTHQQEEQCNATKGSTTEKKKSCKQHIPRKNDVYTKVEYWNERFQTEEEYDWYCSYSDVAHQIMPFLHQHSRILILGCGNSKFSEDLYHGGYPNIVNIDYSSIVIQQMQLRHQDKPTVKWKEGYIH